MNWGLIDGDAVRELRERKRWIAAEIERIKGTVVKPLPDVNQYLMSRGTPPIQNGMHMGSAPEAGGARLWRRGDPCPAPRVAKQKDGPGRSRSKSNTKGYIRRQQREIERFKNLESVKIHEGFRLRRRPRAFQRTQGKAREDPPGIPGPGLAHRRHDPFGDFGSS